MAPQLAEDSMDDPALAHLWLDDDEVADFENAYASRFIDGPTGLWQYEAWEMYNLMQQADNEQLRNALLVRHLQAAHEWARKTDTHGDLDAISNALMQGTEYAMRSDWFKDGSLQVAHEYLWARRDAGDQYADLATQMLAI